LLQQQVGCSGLQIQFFVPSQLHLSFVQLVHLHLGLLQAIPKI